MFFKNERESTVDSSPERAKPIFNVEYTVDGGKKKKITKPRIIIENLKVIIEFYGMN